MWLLRKLTIVKTWRTFTDLSDIICFNDLLHLSNVINKLVWMPNSGINALDWGSCGYSLKCVIVAYDSVIDKFIENREWLWCQHCRHWWQYRLPLWQPVVPPVTTTLPFWQLSFSVIKYLMRNCAEINSAVAFGEMLTLVQVMAWCRQAASHYLNQRWRRFTTLCGVSRAQWVNTWHGMLPNQPTFSYEIRWKTLIWKQ